MSLILRVLFWYGAWTLGRAVVQTSPGASRIPLSIYAEDLGYNVGFFAQHPLTLPHLDLGEVESFDL